MIKTGYELTEKQIAEGYGTITDEITMPSYFYSLVLDLARPLSGEMVLDVGCGNGYLLESFTAQYPDAILYGAELSPALVTLAGNRLGNRAEIYQTSACEPMPFSDRFFDVVTMTDVIEHLRNPGNVLAEIKRILKPGGRAIITYPCGSLYSPYISVAEKYPENRVARAFLPPEHPLRTIQPIDTVYFWGEMQGLLKANGFRISDTIGCESFRYLYEISQFSRYNYRISPCIYKTIVTLDKVINSVGLQMLCYRILLKCTIA